MQNNQSPTTSLVEVTGISNVLSQSCKSDDNGGIGFLPDAKFCLVLIASQIILGNLVANNLWTGIDKTSGVSFRGPSFTKFEVCEIVSNRK